MSMPLGRERRSRQRTFMLWQRPPAAVAFDIEMSYRCFHSLAMPLAALLIGGSSGLPPGQGKRPLSCERTRSEGDLAAIGPQA